MRFFESLKIRLDKIKKSTNVARIVFFVLFLVYSFTIVYAVLWALMNSFKDPVEYMLAMNSWPKRFLFGNYVDAFTLLNANGTNMITMIVNSVWITLVRALVSTACLAVGGYVFSKCNFIGKKVLYEFLLLTLMLPLYGSGSSGMKLVHQLGLYDSPLYPVVASIGIQGMMVLVVKSYFDGISGEYSDAARIDGAGHWRLFLTINLPLAMPCLSSLFILMVIEGWKDYMMPLVYMPHYTTLFTGLYLYEQTAKWNINYPVYFAGLMMACVPTLLAYIFMSDKIMNNVAAGGIKG